MDPSRLNSSVISLPVFSHPSFFLPFSSAARKRARQRANVQQSRRGRNRFMEGAKGTEKGGGAPNAKFATRRGPSSSRFVFPRLALPLKTSPRWLSFYEKSIYVSLSLSYTTDKTLTYSRGGMNGRSNVRPSRYFINGSGQLLQIQIDTRSGYGVSAVTSSP